LYSITASPVLPAARIDLMTFSICHHPQHVVHANLRPLLERCLVGIPSGADANLRRVVAEF
jgi:hypothetical protein